MVIVIRGTAGERERSIEQLMYRSRKSVFVDLLGWDVPNDGTVEMDEFDGKNAVYLILLNPKDGSHVASLRLLRTDQPHLLDTVFSKLCDGVIPRGEGVREVTRFCVSPKGNAHERRRSRNALIDAMLTYLEFEGVETLTAVCHLGMLSQVLSAGWDCRPLGLPQEVDGRLTGALMIDVGPDTRRCLSKEWRHAAPRVQIVDRREMAA